MRLLLLGLLVCVAAVACGANADEPPPGDDAGSSSSGSSGLGGSSGSVESDGGAASDAANDDASSKDDPRTRAAREGFITEVVTFEPGACGGYKADLLPGIVFDAPRGTGATMGSTDVVSLGTGGSIVLGFAPLAIVDQAGPDFVVFENVFFAGGNENRPYRELGEVSVSEDGQTWHTFPCDVDAGTGHCAGATPVYSSPSNPISPTDPVAAGGDAFDLQTVGVPRARYVRIRDLGAQECEEGLNNNGFDLDAIAVLHGAAAE